MTFDSLGSTGWGSSHCPVNFDNLHWYDHTPLNFRLYFNPVLRAADYFEKDKREWLEITWRYWIFYKGSELFEFKSYYSCKVAEFETPPTQEQLAEIVKNSYKALKDTFEERRGDYHIFEPIGDISLDTIEQTVNQLSEVLLPKQG